MTTSNGTRQKVTSEILDRQPPCSLEAERAVLGSILLKPDVMDDLASILSCNDFHDQANGKLYRHLRAMHDAGSAIDPTLLVDRLKSAGDYEATGGMAYLAELMQSVATARHATYYAGIVRDAALKRLAIYQTTEVLRAAYDESTTPADLVQRMSDATDRLAIGADRSTVTTARAAVEMAMQQVRELLASPGRGPAVSTGLESIDGLVGGLFAGELVILGARPSIGKTAMALQIGLLRGALGETVLFVSTEMTAADLMQRALCAGARVPMASLRSGDIVDGDLEKLEREAAVLADALLLIDDRPALSVADIRATARRFHRDRKLVAIVVDYLQRLEPADGPIQRHEQVAQVVTGLKNLARELAVPVLCVAQLNRGVDASADRRPALIHLGESARIEAEADQVWLLHRPELGKPTDLDLRGRAELIVAKNRNGATGVVPLRWEPERTRFEDCEPARKAAAQDFLKGF